MVLYWTLSWNKSGLCKNQPFLQKSAPKQPDFEFLMKWLELLNESPLLCVKWCYIELFPKKSLAYAKISHFCKNRPKNSQILSFTWNGYHFWIKVHYCASNGATLNSFLKKVWPLQKSAIFAKISLKTVRFWVFDEMAITSE